MKRENPRRINPGGDKPREDAVPHFVSEDSGGDTDSAERIRQLGLVGL